MRLRQQVLKNRKTVDPRHHQIEDDGIGRDFLDPPERVQPIRRFEHIKFRQGQGHAKHAPEIGIVLDDEQRSAG